MDRVITYDFRDNFIAKLAESIDQNYLKQGMDISKLAFVFGGARPALFLKRALSNKIKKSFLSPRIFSIDEFVEYIVSKKELVRRISDLDACFILYSLAVSMTPHILKSRESFSEFLAWAREILLFIDQLDLEDVGQGRLKNIEEKADIGYDVPESINQLLSSIISIRQAFHSALAQKKAYSRGFMYGRAAGYIKDVDFAEFSQIHFCGFFYLYKTEEDIISGLYRNQKAVLFFQSDDSKWSVWDRLARRLGLPFPLTKLSDNCHCEDVRRRRTTKQSPSLSLQAGFDVHSEVCLVREILKRLPNPDKTVVVLPDADNLIPLLSEISGVCREFNVSLGYPLKRSALYCLFESIFKAQATRKLNQYYTRDYLNVLAHPLVKNLKFLNNPAFMRILVHKIEEALQGVQKTPISGRLFLALPDIEDLRQVYDSALDAIKNTDGRVSYDELRLANKQMHELLFVIWEKPENFHQFATNLGYFMEAVLKQSLLSDYPLSLNMAEKIYNIRDELINSSFNHELFKPEDIFQIFKDKLDNEVLSFSGSPLKGLQILGLLETRSLNFENVIIMDVNESVLPKLRVYEPLIPREVMISLGLKGFEAEEEIQRYLFKRLISSANNVYLIYQNRDDKEKSRFIEELIWEEEKKHNALGVLPVSTAVFAADCLPKKLEINKDAKVIDFLKQKEYSASSINTYLHCPLRFYYHYVLGLEEKENLLDEFETKDIGNFIHELLNETFLRFINKRPVIDSDFNRFFWQTFDYRFKDNFEARSGSDSFLIRQVLVFRLERFLEKEKEREIKEILCLEKSFDAEINLSSGRFKFKAKIDRIDRLKDNTILIIDYKTGASDIMPETDLEKIRANSVDRQAIKETIKSFQLPLYVYLAGAHQLDRHQQINAELYSLRDLSLDKLFKKEQEPAKREELMQAYLQALEFIISEILDADVPFNADCENPRYCKSCPFFYLCR